jgi:hypothetical protein
MTPISDETTQAREQQELYFRMTTMNLANDDAGEERKFHAVKARDMQGLFHAISQGSPVGEIIEATVNLAYDDAREELKFHAVKDKDIQAIFHARSQGSPVGEIIEEKSMENDEFKQENDDLRYKQGSPAGKILEEKYMENEEFKQENDDLRYKLEEADRKHQLIEEGGAALCNMVHRLPQKLNGGVMDNGHMVAIDNGNFVIPSKARMQVESIENKRDEKKEKCDKLQREIYGMVSRGKGQEVQHNRSLKSMQRTIDQAEERTGLFSTKCEALNQVINEMEGEKALQVSRGKGREVRYNLSLKSMQRTIDQAEERIGLFSTKCEALNQVIHELEGEKALQDYKIEALETLFQEFNADRLGRSSRVTETAPHSYSETRKVTGDDDGFRGSTADVCLGPLQARAEEDQTNNPSTKSRAHVTLSMHLNKDQQDEDDMESQSDASSARQKLIEKSMQNAELKQGNDNLRYKLEEAERNSFRRRRWLPSQYDTGH